MLDEETFTANWSRNSKTFPAYINKDERIVSNIGGTQSIIGVTINQYQELEQLFTEAAEKAETYKQQLIDAGLLVIPPTLEQQVTTLSEQVASLTQLLIAQQTSQEKEESNGHSSNGKSGTTQRKQNSKTTGPSAGDEQ